MKRFLSVVCAVMLLLSLAACQKDDGSLEAYLQQNGLNGEYDVPTSPVLPDNITIISGSDGSVNVPDDVALSEYIPEGGDAIPESLVGSWSYVEIYQSAHASDITVDEAISRERDCGIQFGYISFSRYGEAISYPLYKTNTEASYDSMSQFGIDPSGLKELFGDDAAVTAVTVATTDGAECTTVFLINDSTLIAFGQGMNVFMYEAVEAVG